MQREEPLDMSEILEGADAEEVLEGADAEEVGEAEPPSLEDRLAATEADLAATRDTLNREVEARGNISEALRRERQATARFEKLFAEIDGRLPKKEEPQPPDPNEDLPGFYRHQTERVEGAVRSLDERLAAQNTEQAIRDLNDWGRRDLEARTSEDPSIGEAGEFYTAAATRMFKAHRFPQEVIEQQVRELKVGILIEARQRGVRPSDVIFERAKTLGWEPQGSANEPADPAAGNGAKPNAAIAEAAAKIDKATSLSAAGGPANVTGKSLRALLREADEDEFSRIKQELVRKFGPEVADRKIMRATGQG